MLKSIIVEDEPGHVASLQELLKDAPQKIQVNSVCTNVDDAFKAINTHSPDIVFLDIDLGTGGNGFDLLRKFKKPGFAIIFTTQFNTSNNAIKAIRACALDFLPKPLLPSELYEAINRATEKESIEQVQTLAENISDSKKPLKRIWIAGTDGKTMIEIDNIIFCESDNSYTHFHLLNPVDKKKIHISTTKMKDWEAILKESFIIRIHNEYLLNFKHIKRQFNRDGQIIFVLPENKELPVSRSRRDEVEKQLDAFQRNP